SERLFKGLMRAWRGFTQTGEEADEGFYELERSPRLAKPKSYASLLRLRSSEPKIFFAKYINNV
ncbi:MAG: hypothetical protein QXL15_05210, partial [Candidatus Korarchaeota archaeon]